MKTDVPVWVPCLALCVVGIKVTTPVVELTHVSTANSDVEILSASGAVVDKKVEGAASENQWLVGLLRHPDQSEHVPSDCLPRK